MHICTCIYTYISTYVNTNFSVCIVWLVLCKSVLISEGVLQWVLIFLFITSPICAFFLLSFPPVFPFLLLLWKWFLLCSLLFLWTHGLPDSASQLLVLQNCPPCLVLVITSILYSINNIKMLALLSKTFSLLNTYFIYFHFFWFLVRIQTAPWNFHRHGTNHFINLMCYKLIIFISPLSSIWRFFTRKTQSKF